MASNSSSRRYMNSAPRRSSPSATPMRHVSYTSANMSAPTSHPQAFLTAHSNRSGRISTLGHDSVELQSSTQFPSVSALSSAEPTRIDFENVDEPTTNSNDFAATAAHPQTLDRDTGTARPRTYFTDYANWQRTLGTWDVAALIVNKMIGAGFFTTVGTVLGLTQSKKISIVLWAMGGIYSLISFSIYLEYGLNFPYNGGDLIYVDHVFPWPVLLSTVMYSIFFLCFAQSTGNTVAFARHAIAAAQPTQVVAVAEMDKRLVNLIAVAVLTVVSLLLYFSKHASRALNRWLMFYKIGLFLTVFVAGALVRNQPDSGKNDWSRRPGTRSSFDSLAATIYVIYSYQGWENANYVTGEIRDVAKGTLRRGGFIGVIITTLCYILATIGYFWACSFDRITSNKSDLGMGQYFADQAFGHTTGFKACIALSAFGNLIAVMYTNSMVRQSIALQRFIPFYRFIGREDVNFGTPGGALFLQWLTTLPFILAMPNSTDGYSFVIGIYSYMHLIVLLVIGFGVLNISRVMKKSESQHRTTKHWDFKFLRERWSRYLIVFFFIGSNALVLGVSAKPRSATAIKRWIWPVMAGAVIVVGILYWIGLWALQSDDQGDRFLARWLGLQATVNSTEGTTLQNPAVHQPGSENEDEELGGRVFVTNKTDNTDTNNGVSRTINFSYPQDQSSAPTQTHQQQQQEQIHNAVQYSDNALNTSPPRQDPHLAQQKQDATTARSSNQNPAGLTDFEMMMRSARQDGSRRRITWEVAPNGTVAKLGKGLAFCKDLFIKWVW